MRTAPFFAVLTVSLLLVSCAKDVQEIAQDVGLIPDGCGSAGARLQATVGDIDYCANAQVLATGDGASVIVTGLDLAGGTLVLQLDTLAVGTHPITEATNGILFMHMGTTYTVAPGVSGDLVIASFDPVARKLSASFDTPLTNAVNGEVVQVVGQVEVTYSE
jgi:hypothetical protein